MAKIDAAERLISQIMESHGMCREEAVTAVVTLDGRERHFGRAAVSDGMPLAEAYAAEMQGELEEEQAVRVVAYLQGLTVDQARAHLAKQVEGGSVTFVTKH